MAVLGPCKYHRHVFLSIYGCALSTDYYLKLLLLKTLTISPCQCRVARTDRCEIVRFVHIISSSGNSNDLAFSISLSVCKTNDVFGMFTCNKIFVYSPARLRFNPATYAFVSSLGLLTITTTVAVHFTRRYRFSVSLCTSSSAKSVRICDRFFGNVKLWTLR